MIGLEGLLAPALAAGGQPRIGQRWPAMSLGFQPCHDEREGATHEAIVQLGHDASDVERARALTGQPLHHRVDARGDRGEAIELALRLDLAHEAHGVCTLQQNDVVA